MKIYYAPLAGCSDYPFRQMSALYRPDMMFCEMVKMDALVRHDPATYRLLDYAKEMRPIGAQLCGSKPELAGECAHILEDLGFDRIDLNCGCPVDKVTKDGSGSGMLKTPEKIGEVIYEMVKAVSIPVSVKIRCGWDDESINGAEITEIAENAGAVAITVHGRTRKQAYKGPANWDHIKACAERARKIQVIGNGDVFSGESALDLVRQTGCDGVLVARGTLGKPYIVEDIRRTLRGESPLYFTGAEYRDLLLQHYRFIAMYRNERRAVLDMRRVGCWYLKNGVGTKKLRHTLNQAKTLSEMEEHILNYGWDDAYCG